MPQTLKLGCTKRRRYIIHETNFRDGEGRPLPVKHPENVFEENEQLTYKGKDWWQDQGHRLGAKPIQEFDSDLETDEVQLEDGSYFQGRVIYDCIYISYDVTEPTVKLQMTARVEEDFDVELPLHLYKQWENGECDIEQLIYADLYVKEGGDSCNSLDLGGKRRRRKS
jgi:hypothetical protein